MATSQPRDDLAAVEGAEAHGAFLRDVMRRAAAAANAPVVTKSKVGCRALRGGVGVCVQRRQRAISRHGKDWGARLHTAQKAHACTARRAVTARGRKGRKDEGWWGGGAYLAALVLASRQRVDARQQPASLLLRGLVAHSPVPTARPQFVEQQDDDDDQRGHYADQDEQEDRQCHLMKETISMSSEMQSACNQGAEQEDRQCHLMKGTISMS